MTPDKLKNNKYAIKAFCVAFSLMIILPVGLIALCDYFGWL